MMSASFYVWTSYLITALALLCLMGWGWAALSREERTARRLEEMAARAPQDERGSARAIPLLISAAAIFLLGLLLNAANRWDRPPPPAHLEGISAFTLPPIKGTGLRGFSSSDLPRDDNAYTLINVWASWCAPCRAEHEHLMTLAMRDDMRLFGIAYKDAPEDSLRFLRRYGNPFSRLGQDQEGAAVLALGVEGVPESFLLDGAGRILLHHYGPLTKATLEEDIFPLLKQP